MTSITMVAGTARAPSVNAMHWMNGYGQMGWMGILWILGAVVIGVVIWSLLKSARRPRSGPGESPEHVLKRRYAKGELDGETYQRMLAELRSPS